MNKINTFLGSIAIIDSDIDSGVVFHCLRYSDDVEILPLVSLSLQIRKR